MLFTLPPFGAVPQGNGKAGMQEQKYEVSPDGLAQRVWKGAGQVQSFTSDNFVSSGNGGIRNSRHTTSGECHISTNTATDNSETLNYFKNICEKL